MMSRRYLFGSFLLILFCACSDDSDSGVGAASQDDQGITASDASDLGCSVDIDCPNGQVCEDDLCELGCGANAQCPAGYECQNGRVCLSVMPCQTDADCGNGICDCEGVCRGLPSEPCATDLQCDVQDFCNTCRGECQSRSDQCEPCETDSACASNAKCRQPNGSLVASIQGVESAGVCLRECQGSCDILGPGYDCAVGSSGQQFCVPESGSCGSLLDCANDSDCNPTEFCNDRRRCQPGCADDTECPNGTLCQGVRCLPPCNASTNPCIEGLICDEAGRCRVENGCASSADCPMPETYCDRSTYLCVEGCEVDNDCQDANQQCVAGSCRERGCSGNYQCAFGQVCDLALGQCMDASGRHCESGCDPQTEGSCGESALCVSLQDDDGNALGDFCFEACLEVPNECPQGYQCVEFEQQGMGMMSGGPSGFYCVRDCTYNPTSN